VLKPFTNAVSSSQARGELSLRSTTPPSPGLDVAVGMADPGTEEPPWVTGGVLVGTAEVIDPVGTPDGGGTSPVGLVPAGSVGVAAPAVTVTVTVGTAGHPLAYTPSCLPFDLPPGIVELPGSVVPVGAALLAGGMLAGLVVFEAPPPVATPDVVGTGVRSGVVEFEGIEDVGTVPLVGGRGVPVVLLGGIETVGSVTLAGEPVVEGSVVVCGLRAINGGRGAANVLPAKEKATRGKSIRRNNMMNRRKAKRERCAALRKDVV